MPYKQNINWTKNLNLEDLFVALWSGNPPNLPDISSASFPPRWETSWWFHPHWKILVKMGSSSPNRGEHKHICNHQPVQDWGQTNPSDWGIKRNWDVLFRCIRHVGIVNVNLPSGRKYDPNILKLRNDTQTHTHTKNPYWKTCWTYSTKRTWKLLDSQVKQGKTEGLAKPLHAFGFEHHTKTYWNAYRPLQCLCHPAPPSCNA